jgi:PAT family beta-lactamase induction signal transducer AmpG
VAATGRSPQGEHRWLGWRAREPNPTYDGSVISGATLRSRLLIFGGLYFAQGVPWGFFTVAIALRLTSLGLSPSGLGDLMFVAWLPYAGKPVIGLLVDRLSFGRLGRRRPFILLAEAGMAFSLLAMAFANPIADRAWFSALLFLHNLLAAAQDVGTDALAIDLLAENERGRANGVMSAGKFAGVVLGGQGLLWIASVAGWPAAYGLAIALLLVPATLVLGVRESPLPTQRPRLLGLTLRAFTSRVVLLAAAFALVVDLADSFTFPLSYPLFRNQLGFSEQQVASLATIGGIVSALGALLGGVLGDRLGCRRTLLGACLGVAGLNLAFSACRGLWGHFPVLLAYTAVEGIMVGVVYATMLALFMDLTNPRVAATQFQIYMALLNIKDACAQKLGGRLAERISAPTMFGLAAIIEVLPLVLLPWLDARRAQADFARETTPDARDAGNA